MCYSTKNASILEQVVEFVLKSTMHWYGSHTKRKPVLNAQLCGLGVEEFVG